MAKQHCPYARSDMTPCVIKDGPVCYAMDSKDEPICVGCERRPAELGLQRPADWDDTVRSYYKKYPPRVRR